MRSSEPLLAHLSWDSDHRTNRDWFVNCWFKSIGFRSHLHTTTQRWNGKQGEHSHAILQTLVARDERANLDEHDKFVGENCCHFSQDAVAKINLHMKKLRDEKANEVRTY